MKQIIKTCPYCKMKMDEKPISFSARIGYGEKTVNLSNFVCPQCGYEEGDSRNNNKQIANATKEALNNCANKVLVDIKNKKRFSDIERKFYLPFKTMSKWLNGETIPSAAAVELLRIIHAYPWLENAAEVGFETPEAQEIPRQYYIELFNNDNASCFYFTSENHYYAIFKVNKKQNNSLKNEEYEDENISNIFSRNYLDIYETGDPNENYRNGIKRTRNTLL